jgi:Tfp pilus assembly major pilin PilA
LIVIVVIGILAAITIGAYNGVTARANTSKAQTNAVTVQKKAEAYNADNTGGNGQYPATAAAFQLVAQTALGAVPASIVLQGGTVGAPTAANGTDHIEYVSYTTSSQVVGYKITYWNFTTNAAVTIQNGDVSGAASTT